MSQVSPALEVNPETLLQTFLDMVRIDSPSGEEAAMRAYLIRRVTEKHLIYQVDEGGNLIVEVPGHQASHNQMLVLSGHMDVVPPCQGIRPVVQRMAGESEAGDTLISSDNTTVLGADDKAGLTPILEAVCFSVDHKLPRPNIRLIFTTREETALAGAQELSDESLKANFAVTLDHTGKQGVIINQAPTYIEFEIRCMGKSVHAGIMPEQGINAIVFAGQVIEKLHLGRIDADTTCNIGFLNGGKATNIVPDLAVLRGELRGHDAETLARELQHMEAVLAEVSAAISGTSYEFDHRTLFEAYYMDENHPGVVNVVKAARQTGLEPSFYRTNGGSDNNIFVKRGLPGVVLSAGYMEPHSLKERVKLSEMTLCTQFLLNMLEIFAHEEFCQLEGSEHGESGHAGAGPAEFMHKEA
jgi:tripeptide aminopeptidase